MAQKRAAADLASVTLPRISHGKGSYLYDEAGKAYLDGSGGPAVFCLGHAHPEVNAAIVGAARLDRLRLSVSVHERGARIPDRARAAGFGQLLPGCPLQRRRLRGGRVCTQGRPAVFRGARPR